MPNSTDLWDTIQRAISLGLARTHTVMPAVVVAVNDNTVDVQLPAQALVNDEPVSWPVIPGVPLYWPGGGFTYTAHPVVVGDSVLLLAAERSTDGWWLGQDDIPPTDSRLHDWSDCFALAGIRRQDSGVPIPTHPTVAGDEVHLGAPAPDDAVAVGSKVLDELKTLRGAVANMVTAFNAHVHVVSGTAVEGVVTGTAAAPTTPQVSPPAIGAVSSTVVKIPGGAE